MPITWKTLAKRTGIMLTVCGVSIAAIYFGGTRIRRAVSTMTAPKPETPVIILDAGHGGADGGCVSVHDVPEKGINLHILLCLRDLLRMEGYTVEVTRDQDQSIHDPDIEGLANQKSSDMDNRLALFNQYENAVCFPSIRISLQIRPIPGRRCSIPTMYPEAVNWHRRCKRHLCSSSSRKIPGK